jgi:hypothetical protein
VAVWIISYFLYPMLASLFLVYQVARAVLLHTHMPRMRCRSPLVHMDCPLSTASCTDVALLCMCARVCLAGSSGLAHRWWTGGQPGRKANRCGSLLSTSS